MVLKCVALLLIYSLFAERSARADHLNAIPYYNIPAMCSRYQARRANDECVQMERSALQESRSLWRMLSESQREKCLNQMYKALNRGGLCYVVLAGCLQDEFEFTQWRADGR
ncbi:hypothetical protein [Segnochrobactrum spirostomi]|uniref:DUF1311 domain-containing protein n=1 Tax=Segnochrobactrum spirostomi TaxID=2608987 RepID=A0A6A7XZI4_9HYPH|nr:hypothetical protein [Segnochrobactrum spirostomi]MQT11885.1 hypothetical protein [Segnochrobactrum spirostomi]